MLRIAGSVSILTSVLQVTVEVRFSKVVKWRCNAKMMIKCVCWYCIQLMMYVLAILTHTHMPGKMRNIIAVIAGGLLILSHNHVDDSRFHPISPYSSSSHSNTCCWKLFSTPSRLWCSMMTVGTVVYSLEDKMISHFLFPPISEHDRLTVEM